MFLSFVVDVLSTVPQSLGHGFGGLARRLSHTGFCHSPEDSATPSGSLGSFLKTLCPEPIHLS